MLSRWRGKKTNPISATPKMNVNLYVIEDYENKTAFRLEQNKPNKAKGFKGSGYILPFLVCGREAR